MVDEMDFGLDTVVFDIVVLQAAPKLFKKGPSHQEVWLKEPLSSLYLYGSIHIREFPSDAFMNSIFTGDLFMRFMSSMVKRKTEFDFQAGLSFRVPRKMGRLPSRPSPPLVPLGL